MNNKLFNLYIILALILFSFFFFVITLDVFNGIIVKNTTVNIISYCVSALFIIFLISTIVLKRKLEKCKAKLYREREFDSIYIESLNKENIRLKEMTANLTEENEILLISLLNPSGKKIN